MSIGLLDITGTSVCSGKMPGQSSVTRPFRLALEAVLTTISRLAAYVLVTYVSDGLLDIALTSMTVVRLALILFEGEKAIAGQSKGNEDLVCVTVRWVDSPTYDMIVHWLVKRVHACLHGRVLQGTR